MGCGLKVAIIQFMKKGEWYGEIAAFKQLPDIAIYSFGGNGFLKKGETPGEEHLNKAQDALLLARELLLSSDVDVLILDELNNALYYDLLTEQEARELLALKPPQIELVITGRNAPGYILEAADLVTEMREIKHPYQKGVQARKGIEY